jgi:hypothetical protein
MSSAPLRIAMWSGPRNISTAMMRSFESRQDTDVIDEPFYAYYLSRTGLNHPMRDEVLKSQPVEWREVVAMLLAPAPNDAAIFYQKHMTHHMLPEIDTRWMSACCNIFLIRTPDDVVASYSEKRGEITLDDLGVVRQAELFDLEANRLGRAPPVIDASDVLTDPAASLTALCNAIGIPFSGKMLSWPKGGRASDGVWSPAWYDRVEKSTGFAKARATPPPELRPELAFVAAAARPYYDRIARWKLGAV